MDMKIGLDAGHGLNTAGKQTPNGIKEWELNDKVRDREVAILKEYNVEIINTDNDEGNVDESLTSRRAMYVNQNVNAFVSNHHNALNGVWGKHTGIEVYVDRKATEADLRLATLIHDKLAKYTGLKGRGVKRADFTVINQNQIPAVLVEGGFMDSEIDYPVITSEQGQDAYARAVAESLVEFLGLTKKEIAPQVVPQYKVGDTVKINGVYTSSTSVEKLKPAVTIGTITKIVDGARNPYLLNNGNIGWTNDDCIVSEAKKSNENNINNTRKSNEQIADEIINKPNYGGWGKGQERRDKLTNAGYDYNAIQKIINSKLK
jgi:N-acetylmuramoyl-L-alanine amidase